MLEEVAPPHSLFRSALLSLCVGVTAHRGLARFPFCRISNYCWKINGGPSIHFHFRLTFTSTRLAILMKGMPLFIP